MEEVVKKRRGNPNFVKGKKSPYQRKQNEENTMSQEAETAEETTTEKSLPSDIFSDAMPADDVLPLGGQVTQKAYAAIPNEQPSTGDSDSAPDGQPQQSESSPDTQQPQAQKTQEEILSQAGQTVDLILKGYEKIHGIGRYVGKVDTNELTQLHASGKIDVNQELPFGAETITVGKFFEDYNAGIDENIQVSQEFKDAIRPPLTRIAIKRQWFISDELYVGLILADDLSMKVGLLMGLKKSANLVLKACMEMQKNKVNSESKSTQEEPKGEQGTSGADDTWREPD